MIRLSFFSGNLPDSFFTGGLFFENHELVVTLKINCLTKINDMETSDKNMIADSSLVHLSKWKRFLNWSAGQEENRLMWTALAILGHGCIISLITLLAIIFSGNHFILWLIAIVSFAMSVISYLAALPTRITIPIFFLSVLIDVLIIISCFIIGFNSSSVFY